MIKQTTLDALSENTQAVIRDIDKKCKIKTRLRDIGIINGNTVTCLQKGCGGKITAYLISNAVIAIRHSDGKYVKVEPIGGVENGIN